jgi:anionic cell wall polymer biosynthesis LytR-Cps2A-Psr (LCP) family protein
LVNAYRQPSLQSNFNFIILGVDPRDDQLEKTQVSDSIIVGRLTSSGKANLISIPRDLWVYQLSAKVNQIYPLSREKVSSVDHQNFIQDNFSTLTGQKISKTIVLTTDNLIGLTKIIGGVDIDMKSTYTDKLYPNPEYVKNPSPRISKYITVVFSQGPIHLDETNITEFVRSRKGQYEDGSGGTDLGRIERQQQLISAILTKLKSPTIYKNTTTLFKLYRFWREKIDTNISDQDIFSLVLSNPGLISNLTLNRGSIPIGDNPKTDILYHPTKSNFTAWVYIPQTSDYRQFQDYISSFLNQ